MLLVFLPHCSTPSKPLQGPDTLLVAFRGTASVKNIKADLKAWRSVHPPARGALLLGQRPLVHTGFLDSWRKGGYNEKARGGG